MGSPYKSGPRKLNPVSIAIFAGLAFGIYAAVKFLPPYWTQWQIKEKLRDGCAAMYQMQRYEASIKATEMQKLETRLLNDLGQAGIDDPDATIELDDESEPGFVIARADYHITVTHP